MTVVTVPLAPIIDIAPEALTLTFCSIVTSAEARGRYEPKSTIATDAQIFGFFMIISLVEIRLLRVLKKYSDP